MVINSILVYLLILAVTLFFIDKGSSKVQENSGMLTFLGLLFFSIIIGCRWKVGQDYISYYNFAVGNYVFEFELERLELIPQFLARWVSSTSAPFFLWFIFMALVQIYFTQKTLKRIFIPIVGWGIFFFITMKLQEQMNIVRQGAAICICLYAYTFIKERKFYKYIFLIFLASLFHKSALFCIPIYFLGYYKFNLSLLSQLTLVMFTSVTSTVALSFLIEKLSVLAVTIGYGSGLDTLKDNELTVEAGSGFGIIFYYMRYVILIFFSKKLINAYSRYNFNFYYLLTFISICAYSACFYSIYLQRLFIYLEYTTLIVFAFLSHYLYTHRRNILYRLLLIGLTGAQLLLYLWGSAPWKFIWNANQLIKFD